MNFTLGIDERRERVLRDLALKLGTTVEGLWTSGVHYMYAKGVADLVFSGGCFFVVFIIWMLCKTIIRKANASSASDGVEATLACSLVGGIICLIAFGMGMSHLYSGVIGVIAPDGRLLMDVLKALTPDPPRR